MLSLEKITDFCMDFPGAHQDFPFDQKTMVFKVKDKMFTLVNVASWMKGSEKINLKCDPHRSIMLREQYETIHPGYHMNKKHWNTIDVNEGELSEEQIFEFIEHSYNLVVQKLSKKEQESLS